MFKRESENRIGAGPRRDAFALLEPPTLIRTRIGRVQKQWKEVKPLCLRPCESRIEGPLIGIDERLSTYPKPLAKNIPAKVTINGGASKY